MHQHGKGLRTQPVGVNQHLLKYTPTVNYWFHSYIQSNLMGMDIPIKSNPHFTNSQTIIKIQNNIRSSKTISVCWRREQAAYCRYITTQPELLRVHKTRVRLHSFLQPLFYSTSHTNKGDRFIKIGSQVARLHLNTKHWQITRITWSRGSQTKVAHSSCQLTNQTSSHFVSSQIQSSRPQAHRSMNLSKDRQFNRQSHRSYNKIVLNNLS